MPAVQSNIRIDAYDFLGRAVAHAREKNSIPQCIQLDEIVILRAAQSHGDAAALIGLASRSVEAKASLRILERRRLVDCERESVLGRLYAGLLDSEASFGRCVTDHRPPPLFAIVRWWQVESGRRNSNLVRADVDARCSVLSACAHYRACDARNSYEHTISACLTPQ